MKKGYAPAPVKPKSKKLVKKGYQFKKPVEGSPAEEKTESKKVEKKEK